MLRIKEQATRLILHEHDDDDDDDDDDEIFDRFPLMAKSSNCLYECSGVNFTLNKVVRLMSRKEVEPLSLAMLT